MTRLADRSVAAVLEPAQAVRVVAALHVQGDQAHLVVGDVSNGVGQIDARSFPVANPEQIARFLAEKKADLLIRIAPSGSTICRCAPLPEAAGADRVAVAEALSLIAESELPAALPWYRRSAGVIKLSGGPGVGLLVGWPLGIDQAADGELAALDRDEPAVWTSEVAALAGLAKAQGAVGGCTRIAFADRAAGTLAVIAAGQGQTLARVMRLGSLSESSWPGAVANAVAETARTVGLEEPDGHVAIAADRALVSDARSGPRLGGAIRDEAWLANYGLAFGAAALYADSDPAVRSLVGMARREPKARAAPAQRFFNWVCVPRHAAAVIAACIALMLLIPLAAAAARIAALESRAGGADALRQRLDSAEKDVGFYSVLHDKRWPMTKLLADVSASAPVGVEIEMLDLSQTDGLTIRATAESSEQVNEFRRNLADTRVFSQIAAPNIGASPEGVQFQMQARIAPGAAVNNFVPGKERDFAARTLAERLYGEAASGSYREAADETDRSSSNSGWRNSTRPSSRESSGSSIRTERSPSSSGGARGSFTPPPPVTDEEIAAMSWLTSIKEFSMRKAAAAKPEVDAETKARLLAEYEKIKAHSEQVKGAGAAP